MMRFEPVVLEHKPDWVFVPGDVNSTVACALVSSKLGVRVAHVEAGLRSGDRTMPEEINRILTDQLSDLLFTPSPDADDNLLREGISPDKIKFVGNVMIDTLVRLLPRAEARWDDLRAKYRLEEYVLATLHRPSNVDDSLGLQRIIQALAEISCDIPILFPVHPRTRQRISETYSSSVGNIRFIDPLGYLDFLAVQAHAQAVITDSGGVQEETTYLGVPCLTLRDNTERPITITHGTNRLATNENLRQQVSRMLNQRLERRPSLELWDGSTSKRIVTAMRTLSTRPTETDTFSMAC
jgi:UDP-N-acetylglucosamine 2-epimerase (non-hydrolysing)